MYLDLLIEINNAGATGVQTKYQFNFRKSFSNK